MLAEILSPGGDATRTTAARVQDDMKKGYL